jgi:hypothetical protein
MDTLYFGIPCREEGSHRTTGRKFLAEVITPRFPDGLTAWAAAGQWKDLQASFRRRSPTSSTGSRTTPEEPTDRSTRSSRRTRVGFSNRPCFACAARLQVVLRRWTSHDHIARRAAHRGPYTIGLVVILIGDTVTRIRARVAPRQPVFQTGCSRERRLHRGLCRLQPPLSLVTLTGVAAALSSLIKRPFGPTLIQTLFWAGPHTRPTVPACSSPRPRSCEHTVRPRVERRVALVMRSEYMYQTLFGSRVGHTGTTVSVACMLAENRDMRPEPCARMHWQGLRIQCSVQRQSQRSRRLGPPSAEPPLRSGKRWLCVAPFHAKASLRRCGQPPPPPPSSEPSLSGRLGSQGTIHTSRSTSTASNAPRSAMERWPI